MAFTNLFSSIPNNDASPLQQAPTEREDGDLAKDKKDTKKSTKKSLLSGQQGASKTKKAAKQSFSTACPKAPSKKAKWLNSKGYFCDLDTSAVEEHTKKNDYNQPGIDFSKELENYNRIKLEGHGSNQTVNPARQQGSIQTDDIEQPHKKKKKKKKKKKWDMDHQSQTSCMGNNPERGGHHAGQSGGSATMRSQGFSHPGHWADRSPDRLRRGGVPPGEQQDGFCFGGQQNGQMGHFQDANRFQRNGRGLRGGLRGEFRGRLRGNLRGGSRGGSRGRSRGRSYRGSHGGRRQFEQKPVVERKLVMTQEFKELNVVEKDGRFICRHFLLGKCIKGAECQLEHALDVQNTFEEACKFYIQGCCTKGTTCPYMHEDFPCKFFHYGRKCLQGDGCRFSHKPLTELTRKLLEEAWKRDKEMELANQPDHTEQEPSKNLTMNTADADKPKPDFDIFQDPARPNFYNSACPSEPDTEQSAHLWNTPEPTEAKDVLHTDSDHNVKSSADPTDRKAPVSYSVEAVLGSHPLCDKPKLFNSLFATPVRQLSPGHWSQRTPLTHPSSSTECKEKVPHIIGDSLGSQKMQEKPFHSLFARPIAQAHNSPMHLAPQTKPGALTTHPPTEGSTCYFKSEDCKNNLPDELVGDKQPTLTASQKLFARPIDQNSHSPTRKCADPPQSSQMSPEKGGENPSQSRSFLSLFSGPISQTTAPKVSTTPAQASQHLLRTQTGPQTTASQTHPRVSTDCKRKASLSTESAGSGNPIKKTFKSLFAGPIDQSFTAQCSSIPTPCGHEQLNNTPGLREIHVKPSKKPFQSLFSGPISPAPIPTPQTLNLPSSSIMLSDRKREASRSVEISLDSSEPVRKPFNSLFAEPIGKSSTQTKTDFSSNQVNGGSQTLTSYSEPAETKMVLKTLFQPLVSCHQDGMQSRDTVSDGFSASKHVKDTKQPSVTDELQQKEDFQIQKNDMKTSERCPMVVKTSLQDSISHKAAVENPPSLKIQAQVGAPGFHHLPIQGLAQLTRPQTKVAPKALSRPMRTESSLSATPLKDLFKTFDPTASPFGQ